MELRDRNWLIQEYYYYKQNYDFEVIEKSFVDTLLKTTHHDVHCDDAYAEKIAALLEEK